MTAPYEFAHPITLARKIRMTWPRRVLARRDEPRALVAGRWQSWNERLNRAVFAARSWEGVETIERRMARMLADRRVRCEVFEANNHH